MYRFTSSAGTSYPSLSKSPETKSEADAESDVGEVADPDDPDDPSLAGAWPDPDESPPPQADSETMSASELPRPR